MTRGNRRSKLVLFGLAIVAVPVVIQLALLFSIVSMVSSIHQEAMSARESRNRICSLNDCLLKMSDFFFILVVSSDNGKPGQTKPSGRSDAEIMKEVETITKGIEVVIVGLNPDSSSESQLKRIRTILNRFSTVGLKTLEKVRQANNHFERMEASKVFAPTADQFSSEVDRLIEMEKAKRAQVAEISAGQREQIRDWLFYAIALSLVSSIVMAAFFAYRIKRPIDQITRNLELMAQNKPLEPELSRADELGALDRLVHSVAIEVNNAIERERSLIENAADLIVVLDESAKILSVNRIAKIMFQIEPKATLTDFVIEQESFDVDEMIRKSIGTNQLQTTELTLKKSDGSLVPTRWSCRWSDSEGTLFCIAHDVTREKELVRMKQEFMSMISHDLRSPLTSVIGGLTMLVSGVKGEIPGEMKEEAESGIRSAQKLVDFVSTLLDFQQLNEGKLPLNIEKHSLLSIIEEATETVRPVALKREIELEYEGIDGAFEVSCDNKRLTQVFVNLLANAIKFSPPDSKITLEFTETIGATRVTITDCGPGISEEFREAVFEPFEQVKTSRNEGVGLGLAICKMIMDAHGGTIAIEDKPDRSSSGCRFSVELPRRSPSRSV